MAAGVRWGVELYAAGATLYGHLTGRHVYDVPRGLSNQILRVLQDAPVPIRLRRPDLPASLATVIDRSLAREPEHRFADAKDMRRALLPFRWPPSLLESHLRAMPGAKIPLKVGHQRTAA